MLRIILSSVFLLLILSLRAGVVMPKIPVSLFVNGGETDFSKIFNLEDNELISNVRELFENDQLDHEYSKAYDSEASFDVYWQKNKSLWYSIDLNKDGKKEFLYLSAPTELNELEFVEIYTLKQKSYRLLYREPGHLTAYKIHPNTKEVILFHHQYPCCSSASHNINMVRLVHGKIKLRKKYFIARDTEMRGNFFPKDVRYTSKYTYLNKKTVLRWSSEKITKGAWSMSSENKVAEYDRGTPFRILSREKGWCYVLMCGEPASSGLIVNTANFQDVHIFGWIKMK